MAKGADFERMICKKLSLWWTDGERDDIYWRSQISGARATQRAKKGKKTYGAYGDVTAVDPIGEPLLKLWSIELKVGKSHGTIADVIDWPKGRRRLQPFEETILQAYRGHVASGSKGWLLICQRTRRLPMAYIDLATASRLNLPFPHQFRVRLGSDRQVIKFVAVPLIPFLKKVSPSRIKEVLV